ncbi:hypothetical protein ES702_07059 [subsurface metagenome]
MTKKKAIHKHKPPKPVRVRFGPGPKVKAKKQSRKPEFEKALEEIPPKEQTDQVRKVGMRPGPSQPDPGAEEGPAPPDDLARIDSQLSKAPKALAPVLKIPFSIWANVSQIEEMKLSDIEAEEWARPIIDLLEYYFPGRIPEIVWIWLMFLSATEKVIDSRVKIRYEKRQERKRSGSAPGQSEREPAAHTTRSAPKHNGAKPADSYPQG